MFAPNLCQFLPISANLCQSLPIAANLLPPCPFACPPPAIRCLLTPAPLHHGLPHHTHILQPFNKSTKAPPPPPSNHHLFVLSCFSKTFNSRRPALISRLQEQPPATRDSAAPYRETVCDDNLIFDIGQLIAGWKIEERGVDSGMTIGRL